MSNSNISNVIENGPPDVHHMSPPTAYHAAKLGMWLFLATEVLLFGGLFTAFALYRYVYFAEFQAASVNLDWRMGALNTTFLIFSSFTAALAMDAAQRGDNAKVRKNLLITLFCGFVFLVVKYFEYKGKVAYGLFPYGVSGFSNFLFLGALCLGIGASGVVIFTHNARLKAPTIIASIILVVAVYFLKDTLATIKFDLAYLFPFGHAHHPDSVMEFNSPEFNAAYKSYFGLYYCMTGLHALHVILGMGILFWVYLKALNNRFSPSYYTPVELGALYWHLVDLIWIYLFPLLYLVG